MKLRFWLVGWLIVLGTLPAFARDPVRYDLSLELRTPIYNQLYGWGGGRTVHPEVAGGLKLFNLLPARMVLWVNGEHTFDQAGVFKPENNLKVGFDLPLFQRWCLFSYLDRRFDVDVNRVFVGMRLNLRGALR